MDSAFTAALAKDPAERPATAAELVALVGGAFRLRGGGRRLLLPLTLALGGLAATLALVLGTWIGDGEAPVTAAAEPTISTFAGTGDPGSRGDGGPARDAELAGPISVAVDDAGNVYVGDVDTSRVRRIGTDGIIETVAGNGASGHSGDGGPATEAEIAGPEVVIGPEGDLYVLQYIRPALRRIGPNG